MQGTTPGYVDYGGKTVVQEFPLNLNWFRVVRDNKVIRDKSDFFVNSWKFYDDVKNKTSLSYKQDSWMRGLRTKIEEAYQYCVEDKLAEKKEVAHEASKTAQAPEATQVEEEGPAFGEEQSGEIPF